MTEENSKEGVSENLEEQENQEAAEEIEEEFPALEEEVEPPAQKEVDEDVVEERFYTIPLGKARLVQANKRAPKTIRIIKDFLKRHMKLRGGGSPIEGEESRLIITNEVNERIWRRGIRKPPRKVRVRAARDVEGNVTVYLAEGD